MWVLSYCLLWFISVFCLKRITCSEIHFVSALEASSAFGNMSRDCRSFDIPFPLALRGAAYGRRALESPPGKHLADVSIHRDSH